MAEARLRKLLRELDRELAERDHLEPSTVALLAEAREDIEQALENREPAPTARSRIQRAVDEWTEDHPDEVVLLQRILDALTNVGL